MNPQISQAQVPESSISIPRPPNPNEATFEALGRKKRKRRSDAHKPEPLDTTGILHPTSPAPWKAYTSPYQNANSATSTIQRHFGPPTQTTYSSPYVLPPPKAMLSRPPESPPIILNSAYQKDDIHGHYRHYQPIAQAPKGQQQLHPQQQPHSQQQQQQQLNGRPQHLTTPGSFTPVNRDSTESLSPSAQLLQPVYGPPDPHLPVNVVIPKSVSNILVANPTSQPAPDIAIIDTLTRKKQKQIYSIIGGLQSGIRSCQQQTEHMQRQLNSLQAALGIDAEEGESLVGT